MKPVKVSQLDNFILTPQFTSVQRFSWVEMNNRYWGTLSLHKALQNRLYTPFNGFYPADQEDIGCRANCKDNSDNGEGIHKMASISNNSAGQPRSDDSGEIAYGVLQPAPATGGGWSGKGLRDEPRMGTIAAKGDAGED